MRGGYNLSHIGKDSSARSPDCKAHPQMGRPALIRAINVTTTFSIRLTNMRQIIL